MIPSKFRDKNLQNEAAVMQKKERNARIIYLRNQDVSVRDIAKEFDLTKARIYKIISRDKAETEIEKRGEKLIKWIKLSDDMEKKWPLTDLIYGVHLSIRPRNLLIDYFASINIKTISLNELLDFITPRNSYTQSLLYSAPIIKQTRFGRKMYKEVVHQIAIRHMNTLKKLLALI